MINIHVRTQWHFSVSRVFLLILWIATFSPTIEADIVRQILTAIAMKATKNVLLMPFKRIGLSQTNGEHYHFGFNAKIYIYHVILKLFNSSQGTEFSFDGVKWKVVCPQKSWNIHSLFKFNSVNRNQKVTQVSK